MDRYIAIDNVCAWPNLTVLPDGRIGILFERDNTTRIRFSTFTIDWLKGR